MAYSRGQPNFAGGGIDSRDGYRTANEISTAVSRQPVSIPVIAASSPGYSTATYPGFRGNPGSIPVERDGPGRQQTNSIALQQSVSYAPEPVSAKSYRSFVSTQLGGADQVHLHMGSKNVTALQNSPSSYVSGASSLPYRRRSDGSAVSAESYPTPVSSQIVYTSHAVPGGQSGLAGKVAVASSRRADYSSGMVSDAAPINQPRFRQIPVVVVPNEPARQGGERPDERSFHQATSHHDRLPQSPSVTGKNSVASRTRSNSAFSKEAEVDALTDLLVQNMNVAGNPDFCGTHSCFGVIIYKNCWRLLVTVISCLSWLLFSQPGCTELTEIMLRSWPGLFKYVIFDRCCLGRPDDVFHEKNQTL